MKYSNQVWVPNGLPPALEQALSVPNPGQTPMTLDLYRHLLAVKLDGLIQQDPKEALQAMEMSAEQAPDLYSIAQQRPRSEWAAAIVQSDSLMPLLAKVTTKGRLLPKQEQPLREILELLP